MSGPITGGFTMTRKLAAIAIAWLALCGHAAAQEVVFASLEDARRILSAPDAYSKAMSAFDRSVRLRTERDVSEGEFLAFAARAAQDWEREERAAIEAQLKPVLASVKRLALPLPQRIYLVKTSGAEDADAAYTRQNAIMLPASKLALRDGALRHLIAHELFHVSTRAYPALADSLYEAIGFQRCEVELPAALKARRITNPDAPQDRHCIRVGVGSEETWTLPVLLSTASKEEIARGGTFLDHVTVALLLVEKTPGNAAAEPRTEDRRLRIVGVEEVSGFFEQIGRNTSYIIHPEEIVADNFAVLAAGGREVRSPEILARIAKIIASFGATVPAP